MRKLNLWRICIMLGLSLLGFCTVTGEETSKAILYSRMVFLGSSTTDGNTYPALLQQAMADAKFPVPLCFNAGVGGNVAAEMAKRIDADVLSCKPTMVILQMGSNDVSRKVPKDDYIKTATSIIERLQAEKIPMIVLTTNIRGEKLIADEKTVVEFNEALRALAVANNIPVAKVFKLQSQARAAGQMVIENDGLHPNFEGQRLIARAILDTMGYHNVAVPAKQHFELYPGVITEWQLKAVADGKALNDQTVAVLTADETWIRYNLPETDVIANWWQDGERQRGFAQALSSRLGKAKRYYGVAYLEEKQPRNVFINTGAGLQTVWLNGKLLYKNISYNGWHAGRERLPAALQAGRNTLVIEAADNFFVSVTDTKDW